MAKKQSRRTRAEHTPPAQAVSPPQAQAIPASDGPPLQRLWPLIVCIPLFFLMICLSSSSTSKAVALTIMIAAVAVVFLRFSVVRDRISLPFLAVTLWVLLSGISTFYAIAGKFALREFLKVAIGYSVFLIFIAFARKGADCGRWLAAILESAAALAGLFSIDLLSTHLLSTPLLNFLGLFSPDYEGLAGVEVGIRMNSIFTNPNTFAGFVGIGVLLSLGLSNSARKKGERCFHLVCLFISALSFVLAFSMGASGTIVLAFLGFLLLERKEKRVSLLILMVETLILTLIATFPIFLTSFQRWDGIQPIPLVFTIGGAAVLCLLDHFVGQKLTAVLLPHGKAIAALFIGVAAAAAVYAVLAVNVTGGTTLQPSTWLTRTGYLDPGAYTMAAEADGSVRVRVRSRNQAEVVMHTDTVLYNGTLSDAAFTVPEDSQVVYLDLIPLEEREVRLESLAYQGSGGSGSLKLGYKLLPGFVANRLQGLSANSNLIERFTFMEDGLKLFRLSPVTGLGMGAFESALGSVQSYHYETKYVHNHYIQSLVETGVLGLILFLAVLGLSAAAVLISRRREDSSPLVPTLGAALVFMIAHACVELVFSNCYYLPMALGVLALICLCCGDTLPLPVPQKVRTCFPPVVGALLAVYAVLLGCNMRANQLYGHVTESSTPAADLQAAIRLDRFEWADPMLSYVFSAQYVKDPEIRAQADEYAERLSRVSSNTIPIFLAGYYFSSDRMEQGLDMVKKYAAYTSADPTAWDNTFHTLEFYAVDTPEYWAGVNEIYQMFLDWNEQNMGSLPLDEQSQAFVERIRPLAE